MNEKLISKASGDIDQRVVKRSFTSIKHTFTSRSDARQKLLVEKANGKILDFMIAWDTQGRMTVDVVYP